MFDTVFGLPVHVLVVHAVVVLLPLMSVATLAWAFTPRLGPAVGWALVAGNAVTTALAFLAKASGEALQGRLGGTVAQEHAEAAELLPFMALAVLVASALVQALRSTDVGVPLRLPAVLTGVVVAVTVVWVVRAGHSGSEAVWAEVVRGSGR